MLFTQHAKPISSWGRSSDSGYVKVAPRISARQPTCRNLRLMDMQPYLLSLIFGPVQSLKAVHVDRLIFSDLLS